MRNKCQREILSSRKIIFLKKRFQFRKDYTPV